MKAKKPPAVLEVIFQGEKILPENIPFLTLSESLKAIQRLAQGSNEPESSEEKETLALRLLEVKRGSAVFRLTGKDPKAATDNLRNVGRILRDPEEVGDNDFFLKPIDTLSTTARSLDCTIIVRDPNSRDDEIATIVADSYEHISKTILITGDTTITGRVLRVGGATEQKCGLRVPFQEQMLICKVATTELARKLGHELYQHVAVRGTARWLKTSWKIFTFKIDEVYNLKPGSILEAFGALREAGGKGWDNIDDPERYLEETSGIR